MNRRNFFARAIAAVAGCFVAPKVKAAEPLWRPLPEPDWSLWHHWLTYSRVDTNTGTFTSLRSGRILHIPHGETP